MLSIFPAKHLYEQRKNIGKKRKDIIQTINLQGKRQNPREKTLVD